MNPETDRWPDLNFASWRDTAATLQLWTQIVGKVRLALTPWVNHSWHVPLYVTARGLGTSPVPFGQELLEIDFDFLSHQLLLRTSAGQERALALEPRSVADFYFRVLGLLREIGVAVTINELPSSSRTRCDSPMTMFMQVTMRPRSIGSGVPSLRAVACSATSAAVFSAR